MNKKTVRDVELSGKRVLMRVDFNVPLDGDVVTDDTRIRAALPTISYILEKGGSLVLMSHCGRPKGEVKPEFTLKPAGLCLSELLGKEVGFAPDCIGEEVKAMADALKPGDVLLLENLRFHPEEEGKKVTPEAQKEFARQLAELGDIYVDDAFGTAHRAHASMAAVTEFFEDCVAGFLLEKEIEYLGNAVANPEKPFVAIIGGAKISGKIDVIMSLAEKVDSIIVGGGMVYTFYKAQGLPIGSSLLEEDRVEMAKETLELLKKKGVKILLPVDHVAAQLPAGIALPGDFTEDIPVKQMDEIEDGWTALDIGPKTAEMFCEEIRKAKTVVWNGPMGFFEIPAFTEGTLAVAKALAETDCISIIGGGDSVSAVNKSGLAGQMSHISTGGGASLEFLEGKELPGIVALSDK